MEQQKRTGDTIQIPGDYQFKAITEGGSVQRFWHESKLRAIARWLPPQPDDVVLDVGCGSGVISDYLGRSGARVLGVDGNSEAVRFANQTFAAANVQFRQGLVDELFACEEAPDKIYCLEVIEHIYFDQGALMVSNFAKLLKPGGFVFLTTPNYQSLWPVIEWGLTRFTRAARMDEAQHVARYTRTRLKATIHRAGLELLSLSSMCFAAPWITPLSHSLAVAVEQAEMGVSFLPGSILVAVARKGM